MSEQEDSIREYLEKITVDDYEPFVTGRARGNFLDDEVYSRWAGDVETGQFPDPEDDDQEILGVRMQPIYQSCLHLC